MTTAPSPEAVALPRERTQRLHIWLLAAVLLVGAGLRFATLGVQSYWLDETVTVGLLHRSFSGMLSALPSTESTPPLYYVLAWPWTRIFGFGELGVRSLSALAGAATIPVMYLLGTRLVSRRVGLFAAALYALNPLTFYYGQEARAYGLLMLFASLSLLFFAMALERPAGRTLAAWAACSALAMCTHYFAAFLVAPELAWLVMKVRRSRAVWAAGAAVVATAGALVPLALEQRSNGGADWIVQEHLSKWVLQTPKQFLIGLDGPSEVVTGAIALLLVIASLELLRRHGDARERSAAAIAAALAAAAVAIPLLLWPAGIHVFTGRNLIAAWIPAALVVSAGLGSRRAGRAGIAAGAALAVLWLVVIGAVLTNRGYQRDDWRDALHAAAAGAGPRAIVLPGDENAPPVAAYLPHARPLGASGATVREVALVELAAHESGHALEAPPVPDAPAPQGFATSSPVKGRTYTIARYSAALPAHVTPGALASRLRVLPAQIYLVGATGGR